MRSCSFLFAVLSACTTGIHDPPHGDALAMQPTIATLDSVAHGVFKPILPYTNIAGHALLVRRLDGKTDLGIGLVGVGLNALYTAQLHAAPCKYGGGGHYKIDPTVAGVVEANELWLTGTSTSTGAFAADASFDHLARGEALSSVLHDPISGAKMACADLFSDDVESVELLGTITPFAAAGPADQTANGWITAINPTYGWSA